MKHLQLVKPDRKPERRLKKIRARIHNELHTQLTDLLAEADEKLIFLLAQGYRVRVMLDVREPEPQTINVERTENTDEEA